MGLSSVLLGCSSLLVGCADEFGPDPMPTTSITGRIHRSGSPLTRGWLEFLPVDGTVGRLRSAPIQPDGTFQAGGVAVGRLAIRVVGANLPGEDAALFSQLYLIRREVRVGESDSLEIDLEHERRLLSPGRAG